MILQEHENPMTASTTKHDLGDPQRPSLQQLTCMLDEAKEQYLAVKDRYLKLKRLVYLRRIQEKRHRQKLEEFVRLGLSSQSDADASANAEADANGAEADADRSRLQQEFNDNVDCLRKLKELLLMHLTVLCRRQRAVRRQAGAEAVQQWRQTPDVRDKLVQVQSLKNLIKICELRRFHQLIALNGRSETGAQTAQPCPDAGAEPGPHIGPIERRFEDHPAENGPPKQPEQRQHPKPPPP